MANYSMKYRMQLDACCSISIKKNPYFSGRYSASIRSQSEQKKHDCFNPYFSGRYSASIDAKTKRNVTRSFNPYFSGRYSASGDVDLNTGVNIVSILILVEGTLHPEDLVELLQPHLVSILILVEGTLHPEIHHGVKNALLFQSLF